MKKKCEFCGEEFDAERKERRFCNTSCSSRWHYQQGFNLGFQKGHGNFDGVEKGWFTTERVSGDGNVNYKDGSRCGEGYPSEFKRIRRVLLGESPECEICSISYAKQTPERHMCLHHKDGNIFNNELNNLQVMCNSCHQKLHRELEGLRR